MIQYGTTHLIRYLLIYRPAICLSSRYNKAHPRRSVHYTFTPDRPCVGRNSPPADCRCPHGQRVDGQALSEGRGNGAFAILDGHGPFVFRLGERGQRGRSGAGELPAVQGDIFPRETGKEGRQLRFSLKKVSPVPGRLIRGKLP